LFIIFEYIQNHGIMKMLGIDIGGSGIKGALVDTETGELLTERYRIETPNPSLPKYVAMTVNGIIDHFNWDGAVGCSFPAVTVKGKIFTAGNISKEWIGVKADKLFSEHCKGMPFFIGNDADLAGLAEMTLGAGKNLPGKVVMITIGTGLGTGVFYDGKLIPNFELGHVFYKKGVPMEVFAADSARRREKLKLKKWAKRLDFYLNHLVRVAAPDHFIIGGGISKKFDKFKHRLTVKVPIGVARFENNAGIIGAAMLARQHIHGSKT
jgi:polyphosphate glucokinase